MTLLKTLRAASGALLILLALFVAYTTPGFDDEFHNIRWYFQSVNAGGVTDFLKYVTTDQVHPTGSYLLSYFLRDILGSWSVARLVKTAAILAVLYISIRRAFPSLVENRAINWALVAIVSPSFLIWGTGVRWFGEFTALLTLAVCLDPLIPYKKKYFSLTLGLICFLLLDINYLAILTVPLVAAYHLRRSWMLGKRFAWYDYAVAAIVAALLAQTVWAVLAINQVDQRGTILKSLIGVVHGLTVNHGIYPISFGGALALASSAGLFWLAIASNHFQSLRNDLFWFLVATVLLVILSGIGIKYRNVTPLIPLVLAFAFSKILESPLQNFRENWFRVTVFSVFLITNMVGLYHVLSRQDTVKGSWNLPVRSAVHWIKQETASCQSPAVITWDPVMEYSLWAAGIFTIDLRDTSRDSKFDTGWASKFDCMYMVKTTSGSFNNLEFFKDKISIPGQDEINLGFDKYHASKRKFGFDSPAYYISIEKISRSDFGEIYPYFQPSTLSKLDIDAGKRG